MSSCIEHDGPRNATGYGIVHERGRTWLAHRLAWEQAHGPIPDGMNVLHRCDNRPCVNVEHLELGTHVENMRQMRERGRSPRSPGERNGRATIGESTARTVKMLLREDRERWTIDRIAEELGISRHIVADISKGKSWRHVS